MIQRLNRFIGRVALACTLVVLSQTVIADLPDFTELVENNHKSVVNISTTSGKKTPAANNSVPQLDDSPFGEFFRKFLEEQSPGLREQQFLSLIHI